MKYKSLVLGIVFAGLLSAQVTPAQVWKQEPDGFKGFKFGSSRSDAGFLSEQEWLAGGAHDADHCFGQYLGAERCERIDPIGDVGVTFTFYFRDNKLVEIDGSFNSSEYAKLRDVFIAAYKQPHTSQHNIERTALGAKVADESLGWTGKRVAVFITKYLGNITDGGFSISLRSEGVERDRLKREAKRKAVESIK